MHLNSLYEKARADNKSAEDELFEHLLVSFRLFLQLRIMNRQDSEEIVQDALMTISSKYREIEFEKSFAAWAYRVLKNKLLDYYKAKRVHGSNQNHWSDPEDSRALPEPDPTLRLKLLSCLKKINRFNGNHARILNLHYQGYSTTEISGKLGFSVTNFYVALSRARLMLEKCLETGEIK
jgi:RNA polymerase sigma-70 factor (ECF subfamily)